MTFFTYSGAHVSTKNFDDHSDRERNLIMKEQLVESCKSRVDQGGQRTRGDCWRNRWTSRGRWRARVWGCMTQAATTRQHIMVRFLRCIDRSHRRATVSKSLWASRTRQENTHQENRAESTKTRAMISSHSKVTVSIPGSKSDIEMRMDLGGA